MARTKKATVEDVEELSDLLSVIVENVVNNPDDVDVVVSRGISVIDLEFSVANDDAGLVIGSQRQTINAIERIMVAAAGARGLSIRVFFKQDRRTHHAESTR